MLRINPYYLLIAMIALTLLAAPAGATPLLYDAQPAWAAAVSNIITTPFDGQAGASTFTPYNTGGGLTVSGVNFVGFTGTAGTYSLKVYNPAYDSTFDRGSGPSLGGGYSPGYILATLPAGGVTALAFDFASETKGKSVTIILSSGDSYTLTSPSDSTMDFFGLTSTVPITNIQFSASTTFTMIDNFAYGDLPAEETSEPAALLLGATGLAGIWLARRLRRYSGAKAAA
jgi:hypothetical protein